MISVSSIVNPQLQLCYWAQRFSLQLTHLPSSHDISRLQNAPHHSRDSAPITSPTRLSSPTPVSSPSSFSGHCLPSQSHMPNQHHLSTPKRVSLRPPLLTTMSSTMPPPRKRAKISDAEELQAQELVSATFPRSEPKETSANEAASRPSVYSLLSAAPLQPFQHTFAE
jgi:hypothetical protein